MRVVLDSGPLGLLSNPTATGIARAVHEWAVHVLDRGDALVIAEIGDYEVRRELLRAGKARGLERLDVLADALDYERITTSAMLEAAQLWAQVRNAGQPKAHDAALDGDVILAAQSLGLRRRIDDDVVVATTDAKHLARFVDARSWSDI